MKKRVFSIAAVIGFLFILCIVSTKSSQIQTSKVKTTNITYAEPKPEIVQEIQLYNEDILVEKAISDMESELNEIASIQEKREWYLAYRNIVARYAYIAGYPDSVFDYYTNDEIELMCRVIETECYDKDFDSKCNVASVLLNRIESGEFGENVTAVITKPNQFVYYRESITQDTLLALMYSFEIEDTTDGCIAFRSDKNPDEWYGWNYSFTDDIRHHFYKIKEDK